MLSQGIIEQEELDVLKADDTLTRVYRSPEGVASLFIAYFKTQRTGQSPHSPKNCLPGSGWQPSSSGTEDVAVGNETIHINRYLVSKGETQSLVLYWYQSHGRVIADEFKAKFYLIEDSIRQHRSDTALVRVVIPFPAERDRGQDRHGLCKNVLSGGCRLSAEDKWAGSQPTSPALRNATPSLTPRGTHLLFHFLPHFLRRRFFPMRANHPAVTVGIGDGATAIAPEHVRHGHDRGRAEFQGFGKDFIRVLREQIQTDWRASQRFWRFGAPCSGHLRRQHQRRVPQPQFGMDRFAIGPLHNAAFGETERFLIKAVSRFNVGNNQVHCNRAVILPVDRIDFLRHGHLRVH